MRPLIARRRRPEPTGPAHDPAPSRLTYRVTRLWLTPVFRKTLRLGLPILAVAAAVLWYIGDDARMAALVEAGSEIRREIEDRPEFRINVVGIDGASPEVTEAVRSALAVDLPISSFDLDLEDLRGRVEALPPVRAADLRYQGRGYLAVQIDERQPAALWLTHDGLTIIDAEGHFLAGFEERTLTQALPLVAGEGANDAVAEALELMSAAEPLGERLHGLVRMGERRWDVVLTDGVRVMLPEAEAVLALNRVLALDDVGEILSRDVAAIDLRNPERLTVRLTEEGMEQLRQLRLQARQGSDGDQQG